MHAVGGAMATDFLSAQRRHWQDAELLFANSRWANADQLYGFSAECGLKRLMMAFRMKVDSSGKPTEKPDRKHIDEIWSRYETYRQGVPGAMYKLPGSNPFIDWHVSQRYDSDAGVDKSRVEPHQNGARVIQGLVKQAEVAGLL